ncbi:hypothetical protein IU501_32785 [Nocardia otitidiscaviarum]|uniref:hypothetical protein n=1 Tax=Nocardia otitidiscaviarum TaxID=1823 RepID=UPI0006947538|nr:hypothetical protein [Nocardia otitidiscaviarum]MBF6137748.1 hypothetical protein [Nocardia otitidiscaviarum]MBF6485269.1 hypothetical protein [Nocardia otitidiscaviarum]
MTTLGPAAPSARSDKPETPIRYAGFWHAKTEAAGHRRFVGGRTDLLRVALTPAVATAVLLTASGLAHAAPSEQPGITGPAEPQEQPGVTTTPPVPQVPQQPEQQSPLGNAIPSPALPSDPSQYRNPTPPSGGNSGPAVTPQRPIPQQSAPSLAQDLPNLHAPAPVEPPKVIVPAAPDRLGLGDLTVERPDWVPADAAWKINGHIALMQRDTNAALQSVGINASRADIMSAAMVLGGATGFCIGAVGVGVPLAVIGAVGGGLIGGTIGGIGGAALGTLIPVPGLGTITSGVAGTAIGAGVGAAVGAAALGIPAALAGGAAGAAIGALTGGVATAGDGSDYVAPPEVPAAPALPAPPLHDQLRAQADAAVATGEQAVDWVSAQPGGQQALDAVASAGEAVAQAWQDQPMAEQVNATVTQVAQDVVTTVQSTPETAVVAEAVTTVIAEQPAFTPDQLGPLTDAANGALAAVQGLVP